MGKWEFNSKSVQQSENTPTGSQLGSKAVLLSFGPPIKELDSKFVVCGFIQNMNISQQKQVQELFEVGSGRRFFVDGPTRNNLSISRALFSGPSLMKLMGTGMMNRDVKVDSDNFIGTPEAEAIFAENQSGAVATNFNDNFWMNLSSTLFQNPLGVLIQYKEFDGTGGSKDYGSVFLQNCKISGHQTGIQAGMWLMQESIQMQFEEVIPVGKSDALQIDNYYKNKNDVLSKAHNTSSSFNFNNEDFTNENA